MAGIVFSMGSGVNDSVYGKSQYPVRAFIEKKVENFENNSVVNKIFLREKTDNPADVFTGMTSMSGFQPVGEGGAYPKDEMQEGFKQTLIQEFWKDSFQFTREMMKYSKTMNLKQRPAAFVASYGRTQEKFGASLIAGGISGAAVTFNGRQFKTTCADGKSLFATDHPAKVKGNAQSNKYTDAFSNDALMKAESKMQDFRDDNGNVLAVTPNTIIIPNDPTLKRDVFAAIGADKDPNTANNGFNYTFGRWTVIVWQYLNQYLDLSTNKPWILADTNYNEDNGSALWLDGNELEMKSYIDENTDNNVWKGYAAFIAGFNDWRAFLVAGTGSGSTL